MVHGAGIGRKVVCLRPLGVLKGWQVRPPRSARPGTGSGSRGWGAGRCGKPPRAARRAARAVPRGLRGSPPAACPAGHAPAARPNSPIRRTITRSCERALGARASRRRNPAGYAVHPRAGSTAAASSATRASRRASSSPPCASSVAFVSPVQLEQRRRIPGPLACRAQVGQRERPGQELVQQSGIPQPRLVLNRMLRVAGEHGGREHPGFARLRPVALGVAEHLDPVNATGGRARLEHECLHLRKVGEEARGEGAHRARELAPGRGLHQGEASGPPHQADRSAGDAEPDLHLGADRDQLHVSRQPAHQGHPDEGPVVAARIQLETAAQHEARGREGGRGGERGHDRSLGFPALVGTAPASVL